MRLLNSTTLKLGEFTGRSIPPYAILSHTWDEEEVSFQDIQTLNPNQKIGYAKIKSCCEVAAADGFEYVWIDTCCIDKNSSSELSEAINSMYSWYQRADVCYVYLADVQAGDGSYTPKSDFSKSKWFTRGWTLQELIAPASVIFFARGWSEIGTKLSLQESISQITRIDTNVLSNGEWDLNAISVAQKMSWVSKRETTRPEDIAYCMMGIFDVHMPLLYGEGERAFTRLQEEIMKVSGDHSLFAWKKEADLPPSNMPSDRYSRLGLLASSPRAFVDSGMTIQTSTPIKKHFTSTNKGINLELPMKPLMPGIFFAVLSCGIAGIPGRVMGIHLQKAPRDEDLFVRMLNCEPQLIDIDEVATLGWRPIFVAHDRRLQHKTEACMRIVIKTTNLRDHGIRLCSDHLPLVVKNDGPDPDDLTVYLTYSSSAMGLVGAFELEGYEGKLVIVLRMVRNLLLVNAVEPHLSETAEMVYDSYKNLKRRWSPEPDRIFVDQGKWAGLRIVITKQIISGNRTHVLDMGIRRINRHRHFGV